MRLLIEVFIVVILLESAQAYDPNDSFEYGVGQTMFSLNSINNSNSSLLYGTHNLEKSEGAMVGKYSRFAESTGIYFINQSVNINYSDLYSVGQASVALNPKNRSNLSIWFENAKINISDTNSKPTRTPNTLITKPINSNSGGNNFSAILFLNSTIGGLNKIEPSTQINQSNKSKIVVHIGESIQSAINAATPGDIIEINSGTYNESLKINKRLTIRGVDMGGGLPIIDANGIGNTVEISADQVVLEKIVSTNSSKFSMSPGAGIRFSSSNNCSIEGIVSYDNYYGIYLADSNNNTVSNSNLSNNQCGVRIYYSNNNTLEESDVKNTLNPLDIVSSKGNLIQDNIFKDNLHEVETSIKNKIINNEEEFERDHNESNEVVDLNTRPRPQPPQSDGSRKTKSSQSSNGDGIEWVPYTAPIDNEQEYKNLAQKAAGTLVFNPPKVMTSDVGEWIDARIGLENTTSLVQGLLGKGEVQFRNIGAETNLTYVVKLESDNGFEILAKRPDAQILGIDPAVWLWLVTPLEAGNHTLILSVDLQLEKPPYNCKCVNVTYWPVAVKVLEPSPQQQVMGIMQSSYSLIVGLIAFLASLFSLIMLFRQLKKGSNSKNKNGRDGD